MSNTFVIYLPVGDNLVKTGLIPNSIAGPHGSAIKDAQVSLEDEHASD